MKALRRLSLLLVALSLAMALGAIMARRMVSNRRKIAIT